MNLPSESLEQQALIEWSLYNVGRFPELNYLFHVPNGGKRSKSEAVRFRAEGVKAGVPDLCLPVPRGKFHGLYIEMKKKGGHLSHDQREFLHFLNGQGYAAIVCFSWEDAAEAIERYLSMDKG